MSRRCAQRSTYPVYCRRQYWCDPSASSFRSCLFDGRRASDYGDTRFYAWMHRFLAPIIVLRGRTVARFVSAAHLALLLAGGMGCACGGGNDGVLLHSPMGFCRPAHPGGSAATANAGYPLIHGSALQNVRGGGPRTQVGHPFFFYRRMVRIGSECEQN